MNDEYYDAVYIPIDAWGYATFNPCLVLGIVGPYIKILIWYKAVGDYVELVVNPQEITFEDPAHKTELLRLVNPEFETFLDAIHEK